MMRRKLALQQHYVKLNENAKNRKLNELLEFNQCSKDDFQVVIFVKFDQFYSFRTNRIIDHGLVNQEYTPIWFRMTFTWLVEGLDSLNSTPPSERPSWKNTILFGGALL
jgi:hypothetical protein